MRSRIIGVRFQLFAWEFFALVQGGDRVSPRRASIFSLRRQRKDAKRKATLLPASLRFAAGNLGCSRAGRAAELTARYRAPLKQLRQA